MLFEFFVLYISIGILVSAGILILNKKAGGFELMQEEVANLLVSKSKTSTPPTAKTITAYMALMFTIMAIVWLPLLAKVISDRQG